MSKCVSVLYAVHWIDTTTRELRSSTVKKCFLKCGIGHADESSTSDDDNNMALNEHVSKVQGQNDLSSQSFDEFASCDNSLQTSDNTTTNLENQILDEYHEQQNKIPAESNDQEKVLEENETSSSSEKCSKSPLKSVRATLKCVEDIKSFPLERDPAHLLLPLHEIEKGLCEMSKNPLTQKSIRDFFNSSD